MSLKEKLAALTKGHEPEIKRTVTVPREGNKAVIRPKRRVIRTITIKERR